MNRSEVLETTVRFMIADNKYVTLISRTLIRDGELRLEVQPHELQLIRNARQQREDLEKMMLAVWSENGLE